MLAHTPDAELDAGPRRGRPGAERFCAVTRAVKPVDNMIRFVVGPQGVVPDLKRNLPGRGIWITADRKTLAEAVARKVFARGFKQEVKVAPDLVDQTERLLLRSALDALAIAGKSGLAVTGFSKVEAALEDERIVALIHAAEAAPAGIAKLAQALRRRQADGPVPVITRLSGGQLDLALGRSNVVHAALLAGPASDTFLARCQRLERFLTGDPAGSGKAHASN